MLFREPREPFCLHCLDKADHYSVVLVQHWNFYIFAKLMLLIPTTAYIDYYLGEVHLNSRTLRTFLNVSLTHSSCLTLSNWAIAPNLQRSKHDHQCRLTWSLEFGKASSFQSAGSLISINQFSENNHPSAREGTL